MRERLTSFLDAKAEWLALKPASLGWTLVAAVLTGVLIPLVSLFSWTGLSTYWPAMFSAAFYLTFRLGGRPGLVSLSLFLPLGILFAALRSVEHAEEGFPDDLRMWAVFLLLQIPTFLGAILGKPARDRRSHIEAVHSRRE